MPYDLTLREITPLTHDTHRYVFDRPKDLNFEPGQAADLYLTQDGWRDEGRPFTFTSLPKDDHLEFVIKSYPDHDGVTARLPTQAPGTAFCLDDVRGAISDQGPGVFLAAGAGITPFTPILRARAQAGSVTGCHLIFSNTRAADIILRGEWAVMEGLRVDHVLAEEDAPGLHHGQVDATFLREQVQDFDTTFYVCGPPGYVDAMRDALRASGVDDSAMVIEDGW
ncbi:FAD-binding oxidoreductase [uncultured Tateyamaria sp.]|uniref:FAD-binding oxidoreductase n=1 Tax=uncultured Tateyamaria sp. TaxID=455651 RepID=UPI00262F779E|nr:FAD-binding oxidoreductase [uncultured Tateyamaria sp.]